MYRKIKKCKKRRLFLLTVKTGKPSLKGKVAQQSCDGMVCLLPSGEGVERSETDEGSFVLYKF